MSRIQPLSPELVRLITAGEVVQNPTNVAKELIENSLDAGATHIIVEALGAGYTQLSVSDNGSGMSRSDLELSWQLHTTSKIQSVEHFSNLASFGFRGEALHSTAVLSRLKIRSRSAAEKVAHELIIEHGKPLSSTKVVAGTPGTKVEVHTLFAGVPGRRKHRSLTIEKRELTALVSAYASIYPHVSWQLTLDETLFSWPKVINRFERAQQHWKTESSEQTWPLFAEFPWGTIEGALGDPQLARRKNTGIVSVNNRWIQWPKLEKTVKTAFGTLLEAPMYPTWILHFSLNPKEIDPNIHPQKREIQLHQEDEILADIFSLFKQSVQENTIQKQANILWRVAESAPEQHAGISLKKRAFIPSLESANREISQLQRLYLLTETEDGLLVLDQHAAHERVLYEHFLQQWNEAHESATSFELSQAVTLSVTTDDEHLLHEYRDSLEHLGWQLEPFGTQCWIIRAVPDLLQDREPASLLRGMLDDLDAQLLDPSLHPHHHRLLSTLACRSAIKAGQELSQTARTELFAQLSQTQTNYTCPHGRPVSTVIPWKKVEEWFHR